MAPQTQSLIDALDATKRRLNKDLGSDCTVTLHRRLDQKLLQIILQIDAQKFREELRYRHEEVLRHSTMEGFILILAEHAGEPLGVVYGYDEDAPGGFFLDTLAAMAEGKGIGSTLATLMLVYCEERGYAHVTLYTEERDEKGRQLRKWYERMGFTYLGTEQGKGDVMRIKLIPEKLDKLYGKYISTQ